MSPRCGKSLHHGDVGKVEEAFVELESDEELEAALRREISELSGCDQPLGPEVGEDAFHNITETFEGSTEYYPQPVKPTVSHDRDIF
jgi:hypothetical protein